MSSSMRSINHLVSITKAKELLSLELELRIKIYETRLALPWYSRGIEYLKSGYGEKGYNRTKTFLAAMDSIKTSEELIGLISDEKYHEGPKMRWILCGSVLQICRFDSSHIFFVKAKIEQELLASGNKYDQIALGLSTETAVFSMYEKIINSNDYGAAYLRSLNKAMNPDFSREREMNVMKMRS
jgi:hypothetical protein